MLRGHKWKLVLLGMAIALVLPALFSESTKIPFGGGAYTQIIKAPFFRSLFPEAFSTISYHPARGQAGTIVLWQSAFTGPVMVMPATNTNVLLCLYDYDTCFRLFRIHTDRMFKPLPPNSDIKRILFTSTWEIEDGTTNWDEVLSYLRNVSADDFARQTVSVGFRHYSSASNLLTSLAYPGAMYAR
jgi:hypothetical protein